MQAYTSRLLAAIFMLAAFALVAPAQSFKPLLGAAEPVHMQRTARGISYQSNSFEDVRYKRITKTTNWMKKKGYDNLIGEFVNIANNTDAMREQIDAIYQERVNAWVECGGVYARAAQLDPRRLSVTIEPIPFTHPYYGPNFYLSGIVDGDKIRVVVANIHSTGGFLQHYRNLLAWEYGNWLQVQLLGAPKSVDGEIGHRSPCGK